jgi:hypothetical protein
LTDANSITSRFGPSTVNESLLLDEVKLLVYRKISLGVFITFTGTGFPGVFTTFTFPVTWTVFVTSTGMGFSAMAKVAKHNTKHTLRQHADRVLILFMASSFFLQRWFNMEKDCSVFQVHVIHLL